MKKIGWFTTARGPGSYNLFSTMLKGIKKGEIDAKLSFVFINRDIKGNQYRMKLVKEAEDNGVPVILFPSDNLHAGAEAERHRGMEGGLRRRDCGIGYPSARWTSGCWPDIC